MNGAPGQYLYNAEGQRVAKGHSASGNTLACASQGDFVADETYVVGQSGEQMTRLNGQDQWQSTDVYASGRLLGTYDQQGFHYNISDPLGTKRVQASASGVVEATCSSLPFGDGLSCTGTQIDNHYFTGKERDAESGNDYFGARYYASSMGRFMSPDWSDDADPVPYADYQNPQSLNLYSYAGNKPLTSIDSDGHLFGCAPDTSTTTTRSNGTTTVTVTAGACHYDWEDITPYSGNIAQRASGALSNARIAANQSPPAPNKSSYWSCVRSGLDGFSLQNGLQKISGGRLGTSWLAGAFLGNSVQSVGDTIAALAQGNVGGAANAAGSEAFGDTAGSIATKTASYVPNVAITVGVQAASSSGRLSMTAGASLPFGSLANAGAGFVSGALEALGTFKLPYDLSVASFSAVVCGIGR